jgi:hypothetical protein
MMGSALGSKYWCDLNIRERRRRQWRRFLLWGALLALAVAPPLVALFFL